MKHFHILTAALFTFPVMAQQVSVETAKEIATGFLVRQSQAMNAPARNAGTVTLSYTAQTGSENDFYVFNYPDNGGFIIISADERTLSPILAYSRYGSFSKDIIPSNAEDVLLSYQQEIEVLRKSKASSGNRVSDPSDPTPIVGPLINTQWSQGEPYNGLCPIDPSNGKRSFTGCVATAMAQIMNYWKWPEKGHGYHYNYSDTLISVNYDESTYRWSTTLDEYFTDSDAHLIKDIQKIMLDCGVATNMQYSSTGSAAYDTSIKKALMSYFNYSSSVEMIYYNDIFAEKDEPETVWTDILKNELDNNRPLIMSGQDNVNGGGHAFICDGYDDRGFFHYNFGWGGYLDGYYLPSAINLADGSNYNTDKTITIGIEPDRSGSWLDGFPVCKLLGSVCILTDIIEPYDRPHVLDIPAKVQIDDESYTVDVIQSYAFSMNQSITGVNIPSKVFQIQDYAFYGCNNLESVEIPKSVVFYDYGVFGGCNKLKQLTVSSDNPYYYSQGNAVIDRGYNKIVQGCNFTIIPPSVSIIGSNAFEGFDGIESVILPQSVTDIESEAYWNCSKLKSITLGTNMEAIGRDAFGECPMLNDVYSLSTIPPQIQETTFPKGITVHVAIGAGQQYRNNPYWSKFIIVEDIADAVSVKPHDSDREEDMHYWDLQGRETDKSARGLHISSGGRKYYFM